MNNVLGRPCGALADRDLHARQDPRGQPDALDRRLRRRVRALAVHRRDGRHGLRHRRHDVFGPAIGPPAIYARRRDGRRVRRRRAGPADRDRQRRRDDRQLHAHPADHARQRDRRRALQATDLRQHLHDQAAAPRHRHRAAASHRTCSRRSPWPRSCSRSRRRRGRFASRRPSTAAHAIRRRPRGLGAARRARRASPAPGTVSRRGPRAGAATARALRPRRAAGALARRRAATRLDHPPGPGQRWGTGACPTPEIERGAIAAEFAVDHPEARVHAPTTPLQGYRIAAATIASDSPVRGQRVEELKDSPPDHCWSPSATADGRWLLATTCSSTPATRSSCSHLRHRRSRRVTHRKAPLDSTCHLLREDPARPGDLGQTESAR